CFVETQGTPNALTCTTCHDPHRPTATMDPDHVNAACRSCHGGDGGAAGAHEILCSRSSADVPEEGQECDSGGCYMQRCGSDAIHHVPLPGHRIRRSLPPRRPRERIERGGIVTEPFRLVDATAREQAMARTPGQTRVATDTEVALAYW